MTDTQENKLSMYYSVQATAAKHETAWQNLAGFSEPYGRFVAELAAIGAAVGDPEELEGTVPSVPRMVGERTEPMRH